MMKYRQTQIPHTPTETEKIGNPNIQKKKITLTIIIEDDKDKKNVENQEKLTKSL